jgi:hypothetical protein
MRCSDHVCTAVQPGPECASDNDCGSGQACREQKCVATGSAPPQNPPEQTAASDAMAQARAAIESAKASGKDTREAEAALETALDAYNSGDYGKAKESADLAKTLAFAAAAPPASGTPSGAGQTTGQGSDMSWIVLLLGLGVLASAGAYWFVLRVPKKRK